VFLLSSCLSKEDCKKACKDGYKEASAESDTECNGSFSRNMEDENLILNLNLSEQDFQPFHLDLVNSFAILGKFKKKESEQVNIDFRLKEINGCNKLKITNVELTKFTDGSSNPCESISGSPVTFHITISIEELNDDEINEDYTEFIDILNLNKNNIIDIHIKSSIPGLGSKIIPKGCSESGFNDFGNGVCKGKIGSGN
jgi:hypothetical protein